MARRVREGFRRRDPDSVSAGSGGRGRSRSRPGEEGREGAEISPQAAGLVADRRLLIDSMKEFLTQLMTSFPASEREELIPHLRGTPARIVRMYRDELLVGYSQDPETILGTVFRDGYDEVVLLREVPFYSLCVHHLLPFFGKAHVGYLPRGRIVGLSKLARLVECYARRFQTQERLTDQVAKALMRGLRPRGAACVMEAQHLCMSCRGVQKPGAVMITSAVLGVFREPAARAEVLSLLLGRG